MSDITTDLMKHVINNSQVEYAKIDARKQAYDKIKKYLLPKATDEQEVKDTSQATVKEEKEFTPLVTEVSTLSPEDFREDLQAIVKAEETAKGLSRTFANSFGEIGVGTVFDGTTHNAFIDRADTVNKDLPTIGYGHKMSREEYESGLINIDGQSYSWEAGLSDEAASALKKQDWEIKKRAIANKYDKEVPTEYKTQYTEFSTLPEEYQDILTELAFSIGEGKLGKWKDIYKALNTNNKEDIITHTFRVIAGHGRKNPHKRVKNIHSFLRKVLKEFKEE